MQRVVVSEHIDEGLAGAVVLGGLITGSSDYQTIAQTALPQMSKVLPAMLWGWSDPGSSPQPANSDSWLNHVNQLNGCWSVSCK